MDFFLTRWQTSLTTLPDSGWTPVRSTHPGLQILAGSLVIRFMNSSHLMDSEIFTIFELKTLTISLISENESEVEVMTSSRPPSAVDPMFNESLNLSPVRAGVGDGDDKPRIESLDPDVSSSQVMLHYDNGVSLRLSTDHIYNLRLC